MNRNNFISDSETWENDHVTITANIKNNATGEIVAYKTDILWDCQNDCPFLWAWSTGNFLCDCNRAIFFDRAKGIEKEQTFDENDPYPCSDGKYSVNIVNPVNNEIIYSEY